MLKEVFALPSSTSGKSPIKGEVTHNLCFSYVGVGIENEPWHEKMAFKYVFLRKHMRSNLVGSVRTDSAIKIHLQGISNPPANYEYLYNA